jgi:signal transduction histidine kinase
VKAAKPPVPRPPGSGLPEDPAARRSRVEYLEISDADRELLSELADVLGPHVGGIVDEWHEFLLGRPETRELLSRGRVQQHLKTMQGRYFVSLMSTDHDVEYFRNRLHIGSVHHHVGLEPAWYTGAYRKYADLVRVFLHRQGHPEGRIVAWMSALEKAIYLDMQLALDAYFAAWNRELLQANEALRRLTFELEVRNRELSSQYARAQEAARIKEEFLSRVSHELRTPLNSVLGYADLLDDGIDGPLNENQHQSLRKIRRHGERLLAMIDRLLDSAKIAAAGVSKPSPFEPGRAARRAAQSALSAAKAKGLSLEVAVEEGLPRVLGDEQGFLLALSQLLENAVRYTPSGAVRLEARRFGSEQVRFSVTDAGSGIPEEHRDRVFEAFYQVDFGDTRTATGLGMGLTLAREALERMGGALTLVSSGPEGSTFAADLPAVSAGCS